MRFIESIFHLSPDGGSGSLEGALVFLVVALTGAVGGREALGSFLYHLIKALSRSFDSAQFK